MEFFLWFISQKTRFLNSCLMVFPQELLYYFNVNEIFVEFLETEFIDQNGNKKVLNKLAKVLRKFLIDFEPHSSRINIQTLLNFEQYQMLTRAKYNMEVKTVIISLFGHEKDLNLKIMQYSNG